jgi:hypothetical protein
MKKLSKVFGDRLMDSTCYKGLTAAHDEQEEAHRRKRNMTIDGHKKGS